MDITKKLSILVLSCDKYSDLWDDFFNLKEKYWPDCPFDTYLATDTLSYKREGVKVLHFGKIRTWSICASKAIEQISTPYIALFLEDAFIYKSIDTELILEDLKFAIDNDADFLTLERDYQRPYEQCAPHIWRTPKNRKWGIDTSAAIWRKEFFLYQLEKSKCNAWQFEVNLCNEAITEKGLEGNIFYDDRKPFNISPVEIVRLGQLTPDGLRFFRKNGYVINTNGRPIMSEFRMIIYNIKSKIAHKKYIARPIKMIAKLFGIKFFT